MLQPKRLLIVQVGNVLIVTAIAIVCSFVKLLVPLILIILSYKLCYSTMNHFTKYPIQNLQHDFCWSVVEIESGNVI
jgi:hypothetical protein